MNYRFTFAQSKMTRMPPAVEYELPRRGAWPRNWEWRYDFPEFWRDVRHDLRYLVTQICLSVLRRLGVAVRRPLPIISEDTTYVTVSEGDLRKAILAKLDERQSSSLGQRECMILLGPDVIHEFNRLDQPLSFEFHLSYGERRPAGRYRYGAAGMPDLIMTYYNLTIPVYYLPDFVGIAIIPDLTDRYKKIEENPYAERIIHSLWRS